MTATSLGMVLISPYSHFKLFSLKKGQMNGFDKRFIEKAMGSTTINQGNTWGPSNIHIKYKQLVASRKLQRSKNTGNISTTKQVHRTLDIKRNQIMSGKNSIRGILDR